MKTRDKEAAAIDARRCEGYERKGGIMTLGPTQWVRCRNKPTHVVVFRKKAEKDCSACRSCLEKLKGHNTQGSYKILTLKEYQALSREAAKGGDDGT